MGVAPFVSDVLASMAFLDCRSSTEVAAQLKTNAMDGILKPIDLLAASSWTRAAFTTYALSLSFFEAIVLDALVRGRASSALILSDPEGIRAALSEEGARRVGRDYEIAPVVRKGPGVFHAKVSVLSKKDDAHLLVGSGNLTFSGWGGNLEFMEHLHPSFAADAFDDTAAFFEALASSEEVTTSAGDASDEIAEYLRNAAKRGNRDGRFRLLHSLDAPIAEQVALYADELAGATRITITSPYFDLDGNGLVRLAAATNCDNIQLHAHRAGSVRGGAAPDWPFDALQAWKSVGVQHLVGDERRLHGKAIEVVCRRGRLLLSGSANATEAGLFGRNVEANVLRVQRDANSYWQTSPGTPPACLPVEADEADIVEPDGVGVLSAKLDGDTIVRNMLTHVRVGIAEVRLRSSRRTDELDDIHVDEEGQFQIKVRGIELDSVQTGRLVLRLKQGPQIWEGFVSVTIALELIRRTDAIAAGLIAMLAGTDTPEDVAAILAWFNEDPTRLPNAPMNSKCGQSTKGAVQNATFITVDDLNSVSKTEHTTRAMQNHAYDRAMELLRAAFTKKRLPRPHGDATDDDREDEDTTARSKQISKDKGNKDKSRKFFSELLEKMLNPASKGRNAPVALSLAHFLTDRIRPEPTEVQSWVQKILKQIVAVEKPEADMIIATALLYHSHSQHGSGEITARRFFLKRELDPKNLTVDPSCISAFVDVLNPEVDLVAELSKVCAARTMGEQIRAYIAAATESGPESGFDSLKASEFWPKLRRAIKDEDEFAKFTILEEPTYSCPLSNCVLSKFAQSNLRENGVIRCECCARIILNKDC